MNLSDNLGQIIRPANALYIDQPANGQNVFTDPFQKCSNEEIDGVIKRLDTMMPDHGLRVASLAVLRKPLHFYPGSMYYDLTQADTNPVRSIQIVLGKKAGHILDGSADKLAMFNLAFPLTLDKGNVADYARFYFTHINGPHGRTIVVDTVDDIHFREEPTPALRKSLNDKIIPLAINAALPDGGYQLRGTLLIRSALFSATIDIDMTGNVSAHAARVLADILPVGDLALEG